MKFKFKDLEKKPQEPQIAPPEIYEQIAKEKALSQSFKPKKELTKIEPKKAKKIDFNGIPGDILDYPIMENHNPTIIKLMNVFEDIAGKTFRGDKIKLCKAIIYITIKRLHQYERGELR